MRQILRDIRVTEAKRLLATTSMELSTIATQCGFVDQSHFTRTFKADINLTPGQFRRLLSLPKEEILMG
jgi:transcriptional regulator GlxA family with amidase domain